MTMEINKYSGPISNQKKHKKPLLYSKKKEKVLARPVLSLPVAIGKVSNLVRRKTFPIESPNPNKSLDALLNLTLLSYLIVFAVGCFFRN